MPDRAATLAKLTPPRLYAVTRRERLSTLLDEHYRHHPLIWIAGPPGAGKTSLIASYLAEQKQRTLWYHVDPGDADLATFFHYLAQTAQAAAGRKKLRFPALTPEFMADVPGFTRRFMRELWAKIPLPTTFVLDNYQDLPDEAALHTMLPIALAELPVGATLAIISRREPPPTIARELAHKMVGLIRWEDLRLTLEETRTLASSVPDVDQSTVSSLHATTNGWMAGTILMLERMKTKETWNTPIPSETKTEVFDYFAQQVLMDLDSCARDVLMRTALLPWVTGPMAEEVSGSPAAAQIIRELYQRGLFVDRRADTQVRYQYHDLFREFLLKRCHVHFDGETLHSFKRTAAHVAEQYGQQDTAVSLYAETRSWDELSRLICEMSKTMISQGRYQTLQKYISLLPPDEQHQRPWLLYWSGISRLVFDPVSARKDLESAYQQFERTHQEIAGLFLSCSAIIESYHCEVDDMAPTIPWGDRIQHLLQQHNGFPSPTIEAKVMANMQGLILACPQHPLLQELEASLDRILHSTDDVAMRITVAAALMYLPMWRGDFRRARHILNQVNQHIQGANCPPLSLLFLRVMEANYAWNTGQRVHANESLKEALCVAETFGIHVFKPMIWGTKIYNALAAGDDQEGELLADFISTATHPHQRLALAQYSFYRAGIAFMRGELQSARAHAFQSVNMTVPLCLPFIEGNSRLGLANVLLELGEYDEAQRQLTSALETARLICSRTMEAHYHLITARLLIKQSQLKYANAALRAGLQHARDLDYIALDYWWRPKVMAEILAHALEVDIEVEFVRSVIRRRGLHAPSSSLKHWPYSVKITTLGRFEVIVDDVVQTTTGKTQRKPLELLKFLCAAGVPGAHQDVIEDALWPDADGEAADQAFRTTLHRLRKLLRHDDAVRLSERQISLNFTLISLDHVAFERLAQGVGDTNIMALERALALYHGHFLQGETASWALAIRERLRAQFLALTEKLGLLLEERGDVNEAVQNYLRALDVEPVAEVMCRRVMMAYARLGRRSEAIGVYQRFSQALRAKFGVKPTQETVSLYHDISRQSQGYSS